LAGWWLGLLGFYRDGQERRTLLLQFQLEYFSSATEKRNQHEVSDFDVDRAVKSGEKWKIERR
jgi:hypothetical protein